MSMILKWSKAARPGQINMKYFGKIKAGIMLGVGTAFEKV